jgi:hypothetical protein
MFGISTDAVYESVVIDSVLLDLPRISVTLAQAVWLVQALPSDGSILDGLVLLPSVLLLGNRDQCGINNLPTTTLQTLGPQVFFKPLT